MVLIGVGRLGIRVRVVYCIRGWVKGISRLKFSSFCILDVGIWSEKEICVFFSMSRGCLVFTIGVKGEVDLVKIVLDFLEKLGIWGLKINF